MDKVVIYGLGPFAKLMNFYFTNDGRYHVLGFCVDKCYLDRGEFCGLPVVPFESVGEKWPAVTHEMFVAIGYKRMRSRAIMFNKAKASGYRLVSYISKKAIVYENLIIGENNVVMDNVTIEPWVTIGDNNIIWSDTLLGHNLVIGNHNYISAKCLLAGDMVIKDQCFIGNGAVTINKIKIDHETHVFPGAVVLYSTEPGGRYMGNPAQYVGSHKGEGIVIARG
jgi:UDP-N-acetylbacillosamine N-acetyltransferase